VIALAAHARAVVAAVGCALAVRRLLGAALDWESRTLLLEPPVGAAEVEGVFVFTNRGPAAVRVTDVQSSCGCTVLALDKDTYLPGERGRIRAVFHVEDREGWQSVTVSVATDEPGAKPYELALGLEIDVPIVISPRRLTWRLGDEASPKLIRLVPDEGWHVTGVTADSDAFSVELVTGGDDGTFARVAPRDTWARRSSRITVKVARGEDPPIEYRAGVVVQ
jgi:hypothetical protein